MCIMEGSGKQRLSALLGGESIWCWDYNPQDDDNAIHVQPREVPFARKHGTVVAFKWLDNNIVVGFSSGTVLLVSTEEGTFGDEIVSNRIFNARVTNLVVSQAMGKIAVASAVDIKVVDATALSSVDAAKSGHKIEQGEVDKLHWSKDGQVLTVSTSMGYIHSYLAKMPLVHSYSGKLQLPASIILLVVILSFNLSLQRRLHSIFIIAA